MASGDSHPRRLAGVKDPLRRALTSKICKLETGVWISSGISKRFQTGNAPGRGRLIPLPGATISVAGCVPWLLRLEAAGVAFVIAEEKKK